MGWWFFQKEPETLNYTESFDSTLGRFRGVYDLLMAPRFSRQEASRPLPRNTDIAAFSSPVKAATLPIKELTDMLSASGFPS